MSDPIRVLVVDDSILMRKLITRLLEGAGDMKVVDTAVNGQEALAKAKQHSPDIITLDMEMPVMSGMDFLREFRQLPGKKPRILLLSSLTTKEAPVTFTALELGAADFVTKPSGSISLDIDKSAAEILQKIRDIHHEKHFADLPPRPPAPPSPLRPFETAKADRLRDFDLLAIGASTGGPQAIRAVLTALPKPFPLPVVITQHMPEGFTKSFSETLSQATGHDVKEAMQDQILKPGNVIIAPGAHHLGIERRGEHLAVQLSSAEKMSGHRPSVDWLFESVRKSCGKRSLAVLLTGMGADGAKQISQLRAAGAVTIGQSERTCVVYGMPRVAASLGGLVFVEDLDQIVARILNCLGDQANSR